MPLNTTSRGLIEQLMDDEIKDMSDLVKFIRDYSYSKFLNDKNGDDFILGYVVSRINTSFIDEFVNTQGRDLTNDELIEIHDVILNRIDKIKEAIFQCG